MKNTKISVLIASVLILSIGIFSFTFNSKKYDYLVTITTDLGIMKLHLFEDTPIHRNNFIELAKAGRYDSTKFHRVINNFMIQGGFVKPLDQAQWDTLAYNDKTLANEISDKHTHIHGALAAARTNNPEMRSDKSQFYIVQNHLGSHFLDKKYTVFGQLLVGFDVLDKITKQDLDGSAPIKPIYLKVSIEKVKKKDMIKFYGNIYPKIDS